jgi:hypothetical protein
MAVMAGAAALATAAPAGAAASREPDLKIAATPGAAPGTSVTLKARCAATCKLALKEVNVIRFDRRSQQTGTTGRTPLTLRATVKAGATKAFRVPLRGELGGIVNATVAAGEYARLAVVADYQGKAGSYEVSRTAALHKPGMPKLLYGEDDLTVTPMKPASGKRSRWRVSLSGVQTSTWQYNRDEKRPTGCTILSNGNGTQVMRFRSTKSVVATYGHQGKGTSQPMFVTAVGLRNRLRVPITIDVDRKGVENKGASGPCGPDDGIFGGEQDGGPPKACNGKGKIAANAELHYEGRELNAMRDALEAFVEKNTGIDCPLRLGEWQGLGDLLLFMAANPRGDLDAAGNAKKVIVILRRTVNEPLPGGTAKTTARWTVTFTRVGR